MPFLEAFMVVAPELFTTETATAIAAEAAAAEAAAVEAAQIAAANTTAVQAAAAQQATQAGAGIMEVGGTAANTAAPLTTPEAVQAAAQQASQNVAPETLTKGIQGVPNTPFMPEGGVPPEAFNPYTAPLPPISPAAPPANASFTPYMPEGGVPPPETFNPYTSPLPTATPPSALERGMSTAVEFAKKNPFTTMMGATMGAQALGLLKPNRLGGGFGQKEYDGPLSKYKLSPDFKSSTANPANFQYNPKGYAGGNKIGRAHV